jgi:AraC-like DNA-binding protein
MERSPRLLAQELQIARLAAQGLSIAEVAFASGFGSLRQFNRAKPSRFGFLSCETPGGRATGGSCAVEPCERLLAFQSALQMMPELR